VNVDLFFFLAGTGAFLVGLSKGGLPTIGMLAVPIMSLVTSPVTAAVLLLPIYVISDLVGIWLYRRDFSRVNLRLLAPAGVLGVAVGWSTASLVSERAITFLIGFMGFAFCLNAWLKNNGAVQPAPVHRGKAWFWGGVAGFTSFISHAGGPPFQIYMLPQKLSKAQFAGTSTLFFAIVNAAKIAPYQQLRPYTAAGLWDAALLVPFALVGTVLGAYLTRRLADKWFYRLVQVGLFGVSLKLMADGAGWVG
jgi:uncharacterized membrane protein YfcA